MIFVVILENVVPQSVILRVPHLAHFVRSGQAQNHLVRQNTCFTFVCFDEIKTSQWLTHGSSSPHKTTYVILRGPQAAPTFPLAGDTVCHTEKIDFVKLNQFLSVSGWSEKFYRSDMLKF